MAQSPSDEQSSRNSKKAGKSKPEIKKTGAASAKPGAASARKNVGGKASSPAQRRPTLRITKACTKAGDGGQTRLADGRAVPKGHPRLEAYGTVDELQVAIGAARDALAATRSAAPAAVAARLGLLGEHLACVENMLFTLGGDLATPLDSRRPGMPEIGPENVAYLERLIDACNDRLPPLRDFVLPGGHPAVTTMHACRVICRRAERAVARLQALEPIGPMTLPFMNRLSDVFFVLARAVAMALREAGLIEEEVIWRRDFPVPPLP